jgi:hypothetical protein
MTDLTALVDALENAAFYHGTEYRVHGSENYSPEWREARTKLDAAIDSMKWRPIETTPIDERILIAATPDWVVEALVLPDSETAMGEPVTRRIYCHADGDEFHPSLVPTHWMPLPKHPEEK